MKNMFLIFICIFFLACEKDDKSTNLGDIYVKVYTLDGYEVFPLEGASVYTVPASKTGTTDEFGTCLLKDIEAGYYEIHTQLDGYRPGMIKFQVKRDSVNTVNKMLVSLYPL